MRGGVDCVPTPVLVALFVLMIPVNMAAGMWIVEWLLGARRRAKARLKVGGGGNSG